MNRDDFHKVASRLLEAISKVPEGSPEELLLLTRLSEVVGERLVRSARPTLEEDFALFAGGCPAGEAEHHA
jgi:hypothetical protein